VTGRAGQKLGTVLALIPVLVWFGVLAWSGWSGVLDTPAGDALAGYMLIGLFAFLIGSNFTERGSVRRGTSGGRSEPDGAPGASPPG
jgi:hypothetical protein